MNERKAGKEKKKFRKKNALGDGRGGSGHYDGGTFFGPGLLKQKKHTGGLMRSRHRRFVGLVGSQRGTW